MLPQAQPDPLCLSWDLAGGLVAVMSQMWHWELWGFSTAVSKRYPLVCFLLHLLLNTMNKKQQWMDIISKNYSWSNKA